MTSIVYFIFCFAVVFMPKSGVFDWSVVLPLVLLPFFPQFRWKLSASFFSFAGMILILIIYQIFIQLFNARLEFESVGRLIRALITVIAVGFAFSSGGEAFGRKIYKALILALIVHGLLIVFAAFFYPLNEFLSSLSGNDRIQEFRASGLLAGFDIAGLLNIIGMALILYDAHGKKPYIRNTLFLVILFLSCFFTSRISMAIAVILFSAYLLGFLRRSDVSRCARVAIFVPLGGLFIVLLYQFSVVLNVTFSLWLLDVDPTVAAAVVARHAVQDPNTFLWMDMFYVPRTTWQLIFGTGASTLDSDVGYVTDIFRYGLIGLSFAICAHFVFISKSISRAGHADQRAKKLIAFVFILMLLLSLKNDYIFVRGIFPVFLIVVGALVRLSPQTRLA